MANSTVGCFSSLIYLENFYCVNRSYCINDKRKQIYWNSISIVIFFSILVAVIADAFNSGEISLYKKMFQGFLITEFLFMIFSARCGNITCAALKRIDEKCGVDEKYINKLKKKVQKQTFISVSSAIIDIIGMYVNQVKYIDIYVFLMIRAAHEAETVFIALIIEGINLRLLKLKEVTPRAGSGIYRHILIAASQMSEEFTSRILLIVGVILVTTVSYSCAILLMFSEKGIKLALYLLWRELKSMYCIWKLCQAFTKGESICQQLGFHLAEKLAFDPAFNKAKNRQAYSVVHRWYTTLLHQRPCYMRGSVLNIGLSIPLHLVDISINYVFIIAQIYLAYK